MKQNLQKLMPYFFWLLLTVVSVLMLIELAPKRGGWPYWDKVQHMAIFMMLMSLGLLAFPRHKRLLGSGLILFGAITEVLQSIYTTTRVASVYDWLADSTGVAIIFIIFVVFFPKKNGI